MTENHNDTEEEKPPGFSSWNSWYALLLGTLAVLVALFYLFTNTFS